MPHSHDVMTKPTAAAVNNLTSPIRFAKKPVNGTETAFATAKEVMTHVP
nr:hypothetical protein [Neisseria meningitidis]